MQIVIQLSAPAEGSGFEDDDMESGDNGFPGDADEGEVAFSSWPEIAVCYLGFAPDSEEIHIIIGISHK